MSISDKIADTITYLRESRNAIIARGGTIASNAGLKDLPLAISNIPIDSNISFYDDATEAYSKIVPVGAQPQAQLISVGGMTRVETGANLLTMGVRHLNLKNADPPYVFSKLLPAGTYRYFEKIEYDYTMDDPDFSSNAYVGVGGAFATNYDGEGDISINTSEAFVLDKEYYVVLEYGVAPTSSTPSVSIHYNYTGGYADKDTKYVAVTIGKATENITCSPGKTLYIWVNSNSYFNMTSSGGEIASQKLRPDTYSFTVSREFDESETAVNFTFTEDLDFTIPITIHPMIYAVPDDSEKYIREEYEPYKHILVPTPVSEIVSKGANLYDANNVIAGSFNTDGSFLKMPHLLRTEVPISIISGEKYTISCDPTYDLRFLYFYDFNEGYISNIWMNRPTSHYYTFTAPSEAAFVHFGFELDGKTSGDIDVNVAKANSKVQLQFGSVATEYKPYSAEPIDTVAIPNAVKNDAEWGYGIRYTRDGITSLVSNDCDFNAKKYIKYIPEKVKLDGTEGHQFVGNSPVGELSRFYFPIQRKCKDYASVMATNFKTNYSNAIGNVYLFGSNAYFFLPPDITTVAKANKWLAENPTEMVYAIEEPTVITVEDESYTPPKYIKTEEGGTLTFNNDAKQAVPSTVKYLIKTT